jgi:hypothetical protein
MTVVDIHGDECDPYEPWPEGACNAHQFPLGEPDEDGHRAPVDCTCGLAYRPPRARLRPTPPTSHTQGIQSDERL